MFSLINYDVFNFINYKKRFVKRSLSFWGSDLNSLLWDLCYTELDNRFRKYHSVQKNNIEEALVGIA